MLEDNFETPATIIKEDFDYERNKKFFGCSDLTDAQVDELVEVQLVNPANGWLAKMPLNIQRVYAMSIEFAKNNGNPQEVRELYGPEGRAWQRYG